MVDQYQPSASGGKDAEKEIVVDDANNLYIKNLVYNAATDSYDIGYWNWVTGVKETAAPTNPQPFTGVYKNMKPVFESIVASGATATGNIAGPYERISFLNTSGTVTVTINDPDANAINIGPNSSKSWGGVGDRYSDAIPYSVPDGGSVDVVKIVPK